MHNEAWLNDFDAALSGPVPARAQEALLKQWGAQAALDGALADVSWLKQHLQDMPKASVPSHLNAKIHEALKKESPLPDAAPDLNFGVGPYLLGHDLADLEDDEFARLDHVFADEESSHLALAQLAALETALNELPPPPPMPGDMLQRIRMALAQEDSPPSLVDEAKMENLRWACLPEEEEEGPLPLWAESVFSGLEGDAAPALGASEAHAFAQMLELRSLMQSCPKAALPENFEARLHAAMAHEAGASSREASSTAAILPFGRVAWFRRPLASGLGGALAAALAMFFFLPFGPSELPRIETAAVQAHTAVAVNIGFDVASDLDGVTFQIDLPEGLKFLDDKRQPLLAQSVSWRGSLKAGRTVVPVQVQGVRPGRYEIEAYVRKGQMMQKTTIVLPVKAAPEG